MGHMQESVSTDFSALTEKRFVFRLLEIWDYLKQDKRFPSQDDFNTFDAFGLWDHCFLLELNENPSEWHFIYMGNSLKAKDWKNEFYTSLFQIPSTSLIQHALSNISFVMNKEAPYIFGGQIVDDEHTIIYRMILLPLSKDGTSIDSILGGISSDKYDTYAREIDLKYQTKREEDEQLIPQTEL